VIASDVRAAAVFDLDNTLVRGSSLFHFGREMVRRRRLKARHVIRFAGAEAGYVLRRGEPTGISSTVADRTLGLVAGMRQSDLLDLAVEFAETRLHRHLSFHVYQQVIGFKRAGFTTVLATASPQELAGAVAAALGMSAAIGTVSEVTDGMYTGRLCGPVAHGPVKAQRVRALLAEHGLDARRSWAFSDSVNDLPLLTLVGNPVATHADPELRVIARTNGWRILTDGQKPEWSSGLGTLNPFAY
jgi:HAD superfamily hydrolase (TIGR01490 family)